MLPGDAPFGVDDENAAANAQTQKAHPVGADHVTLFISKQGETQPLSASKLFVRSGVLTRDAPDFCTESAERVHLVLVATQLCGAAG